jgi:O-antigen/teichoic acid export membrane protein
VKSQGLLGKAQASIVWSGGFRLFHTVLQFVVTLVLVRWLTPDDYGTYAVVAGIVGFLNAVTFDNFLCHILQLRDDERVDYQDHFTAAVFIQLVIFAVTNAVALGLRWIPAYSGVAHYIHYLSPIILLSSIGGFRYRILERSLDWRRYRTLQMLGVLLTSVVVLTLAFSGAGVIALLVAPSVKYLPPAIDLFVVKRWRPTWEFSMTRYRPAFEFGTNRVASALVVKGHAMLEANWLAFLFGLATLGYLNRAISLTQIVAVQFGMLVAQAVYPVLTRVHSGTPKFQLAASLVFRGIAWAIIPMACVLGLLAVPAVRTLFGEKWLVSAEYLPLALGCGCLVAIGQSGSSILLANGHPVLCLRYDMLRLLFVIVALTALYWHESVKFYLAAVGGLELLALMVLVRWFCHTSAMSVEGMAGALLPPLLAAGVSCALVLSIIPVDGENVTLFSHTSLLTVVVFAVVYTLFLRMLFSQLLFELVQMLPLNQLFSRLLMFRPRLETKVTH